MIIILIFLLQLDSMVSKKSAYDVADLDELTSNENIYSSQLGAGETGDDI